MFTASRKIQKDKGLEPTEFEYSVAQVNPFSVFGCLLFVYMRCWVFFFFGLNMLIFWVCAVNI